MKVNYVDPKEKEDEPTQDGVGSPVRKISSILV